MIAKKKKYIILLVIVLYTITYVSFGKKNVILEIIKNEPIEKKTDSINVFLLDYNLDEKYDNLIINYFKNQGFNKVGIYYNRESFNENELNYFLEIKKLTPFITFSYISFYKKPDLVGKWESIHIWFFFKWIRVYRDSILLL